MEVTEVVDQGTTERVRRDTRYYLSFTDMYVCVCMMSFVWITFTYNMPIHPEMPGISGVF